MTFERPDLLGLAPVLVLLTVLALLNQWRRGVRLVEAFGGTATALRLMGRRLDRFPVLRMVVVLASIPLLVLAAAGPTPDVGDEAPVTPVDLLIAVDVSHSMTGTDIAPSRIRRAQELVVGIVSAGIADRVALTVFADWAYRLVPLTDDGAVVDFFAPWVVPDLVSSRDQGTSLGLLVEHAVETWRERPGVGGIPIILVVSDGEAHDGAETVLSATRAAVDAGALVWTAGIGTPAGSPLTLAGSTAPLLDGSGTPVVAGYDEGLLRQMADAGRGAFHEITDAEDVDDLIADLRSVSGRADAVPESTQDPTVWLILAGLGLLLIDALLDAGVFARRRT